MAMIEYSPFQSFLVNVVFLSLFRFVTDNMTTALESIVELTQLLFVVAIMAKQSFDIGFTLAAVASAR